jgi:hypothetical protein
VAITPVDKLFSLKEQEALFFPRISDAGIIPMAIARKVIVIREGRKSW